MAHGPEYAPPVTQPERLPDDLVLPAEVDESLLPAVQAAELDVVRRRDLIILATEEMATLLDVEVSIPNLLTIAQEVKPSTARLNARRALRCLYQIGVDDSIVVRAVGEDKLYHYVEGVMSYGASRATYLGLMGTFGLSAQQTTGLYELRRLVTDHAQGIRVSFPLLHSALEAVGITEQDAAEDTDFAMRAFEWAGFFATHVGNKYFDHDRFIVPGTAEPASYEDPDDDEAPQFRRRHFWVRNYAETTQPKTGLDPEDDPDEAW